MSRTSDMVWTRSDTYPLWVSRTITAGDLRRRALMRQWQHGEIDYKTVAAIIRAEGIDETTCAIAAEEISQARRAALLEAAA